MEQQSVAKWVNIQINLQGDRELHFVCSEYHGHWYLSAYHIKNGRCETMANLKLD